MVADLRMRYDPSAAVGVPAHITINYPFIPAFTKGDGLPGTLRQLFARFPAFSFSLAEVRTFPGVAYLAPEPTQPFVELIRAVAERFPESPPYGGKFPEIVPHMTIADIPDPEELPPILEEVRRAVRSALPLPSRALDVWMMDNADGPWATRQVFPLGRS